MTPQQREDLTASAQVRGPLPHSGCRSGVRSKELPPATLTGVGCMRPRSSPIVHTALGSIQQNRWRQKDQNFKTIFDY